MRCEFRSGSAGYGGLPLRVRRRERVSLVRGGRRRHVARLLLVAVAAVVLAGPATGAAARPTIDLSSHWRFHLGDVPGASAKDFDDSSWLRVSVPHTWNALDAQDGGQFGVNTYHRGVGWYRKAVTVPAGLRGRPLFLQFNGASIAAEVYVNGVLVGHHEGAFTRFRVDVTEALANGGTIAVKVDNSERPDIAPLIGDFPMFGGLYRRVLLVSTAPAHLA